MNAFVPESAANDEAQAQADAQAVSQALEEVERPPATERLAASRERLRVWMIEADGRRGRRRRAEAAAAAGRKPPIADRWRDIPVVGLVADAFDAWWSSHPLHGVAGAAQGAAQDRLAPLVRRHPLATMAGAFVIGMLLLRLKPWRWLARSAMFAGIAGRLVSRAIAAIPLEALLGVLLARKAGSPAPPEAQAAAAEAGAAQTSAAAAQPARETRTTPQMPGQVAPAGADTGTGEEHAETSASDTREPVRERVPTP